MCTEGARNEMFRADEIKSPQAVNHRDVGFLVLIIAQGPLLTRNGGICDGGKSHVEAASAPNCMDNVNYLRM